MKKLCITLLATVAIMTGTAQADTLTVVTPDDLANQANFPTSPYGWDWSQGAPQGSTAVGGASIYGTSSWYSNVQGSAANVLGDRDYTALRLNLFEMFGGPVTMSMLEEVSYWTYLESGTLDWQLKIYTASTDLDPNTWYDHRFNFTPPTNTAGSWQQSSTNDNLSVNWIAGLGGNQYPGNQLPSLYTLADASASSDYANEVILFIDIIAGYASSSPPVYSYLDGVALTANGVTHTLDLAVVPIPAAAPLGLLGMGLVAFVRRRKNAKA